MKTIATITAIFIAFASGCNSVQAAKIKDDEAALRFRLKNELRRADKPSAGTAANIYAWVQGGMIDFNSRYYSQFIGVEGGAYYVYKLGARDNMNTRWYLDGHNSFGYTTGAIKIKPAKNMLLKIGRFGTDYGYGSLPWKIPLIDASSQRTLPAISEGMLGYLAISPNIELWAMWRTRVFQYTDADRGIRNEGVWNYETSRYDQHRPRTFFALSWHDINSRYSVAVSMQNDVSTQMQSIFEKRILLAQDYTLKGELLGFYAKVEGLSRSISQPNETALTSGLLTWSTPWGSLFASAGYLQHAVNGAAVNTDIGYPFSLSLDRNREGMQSWQAGVSYRLAPQLTIMLAPIVTKGYESSRRDIQIKGLGVLGAVNYLIDEGPLQGMNVFLSADKGREQRKGSVLGDQLNYWDVKLSIQYDFMLK